MRASLALCSAALVFLAALSTGACGKTTDDPDGALCATNEQRACGCSDGEEGFQTCQADQRSFTECSCGGSGDGDGDTGGSPGDGDTGGSPGDGDMGGVSGDGDGDLGGASPGDGDGDLGGASPGDGDGDGPCLDDSCTAVCGNSWLEEGEACDDGGVEPGDGCDESCLIEENYSCRGGLVCPGGTGNCRYVLPATYRDFAAEHPAFESGACAESGTPGMVEPELAQGKPVWTTEAADCFAEGSWYVDSADSVTVERELVLFQDGDSFANRYGEDGERWSYLDNQVEVAESVSECEAEGCVQCAFFPGGCTGDTVFMDGTPFFFPIDGIEGAQDNGGYIAKIDAIYSYDKSYREEHEVIGGGEVRHNFHFTSEFTFQFRFDPKVEARIEILGDDDIWVFVNGKLVIDLGGTHTALGGEFTLDEEAGAEMGLTVGEPSTVKIFHAERKLEGSSLMLRLNGFEGLHSTCVAD